MNVYLLTGLTKTILELNGDQARRVPLRKTKSKLKTELKQLLFKLMAPFFKTAGQTN